MRLVSMFKNVVAPMTSFLTLKLPSSKLSVFNIYRPPSSSKFSKPFSVFLDEFSFFLSSAATTPHEFLITGDFNIYLENASDNLTAQFHTLLSSFNPTHHVNFPTHDRNHTLDLVITSSDTRSLYLSFPATSLYQITSLFSPNFQLSPLLFLLRHFIPSVDSIQ